jgi:hypothetical protein
MHSKLDIIVEQSHFLAWLKGRQSNVRASIAAEGISQGTVATAAHLAFNSEVNLGHFIIRQPQCL